MKMFGQKTKEDLATDLRFWKPPCNVTNKEALKAIREGFNKFSSVS